MNHKETSAAVRERKSLNGVWECHLATDTIPPAECLGDLKAFDRTIAVPGAWQAQGIGERSGIVKNDFSGAVWYRKSVAIPASWAGKAVRLKIGGSYRFTRSFVNGLPVGDHDGISAPYAFDITAAVRFGEENAITIWISNVPNEANTAPTLVLPNPEPMIEGGDVPTGMINYITKWGGIYEDVELEAIPPSHIESITFYTIADCGGVRFEFECVGDADQVMVSIRGFESAVVTLSNGKATVDIAVPGARLWTTDDPFLYTASIALLSGGKVVDMVEERVGIRMFTVEGRVLRANGKPLYLRGYGDDNVEVMTGFPCADRETIRRRLLLAKSFGFNTVRFHSMTPPQTYFEVADEVGMLIMAELPAAYIQYFYRNQEFLRGELRRALCAYRNHPSLLSLAFGNEFMSSWVKLPEQWDEITECVNSFYKEAKTIAPNALILSNDGFEIYPSDIISGQPETIEREVPYIRHEFGDYHCSLPDISQIEKLTGVLMPTWLEAKQEWVQSQDLADDYPAFVRNSHRLQQIARKHHIETVRKQEKTTGYHHWLILDYPAGTIEGDSWEEGWFDYWWNPKGISPNESRQFNNAVVPLIDLEITERTLWADTPRPIGILLSNYGDEDVAGGSLTWSITVDGNAIESGTLTIDSPMGSATRVGEVLPRNLPGDRAREIEFRVDVAVGPKRYTNCWSFWTFARAEPQMPSIAIGSSLEEIRRRYPFIAGGEIIASNIGLWITDHLDNAATEFLTRGGAVWLHCKPAEGEDKATLLPAFGGKQGTVIRHHPALEGFPNNGMCDLQFFHLMNGARCVSLNTWPRGIDPIVGGIRATSNFLSYDKQLSHFGLVFEARVGRGRLLVTTLDLLGGLAAARPEAAALSDSLLHYAAGSQFSPTVEIDDEDLAKLRDLQKLD